jgi:hypothetical protein
MEKGGFEYFDFQNTLVPGQGPDLVATHVFINRKKIRLDLQRNAKNQEKQQSSSGLMVFEARWLRTQFRRYSIHNYRERLVLYLCQNWLKSPDSHGFKRKLIKGNPGIPKIAKLWEKRK